MSSNLTASAKTTFHVVSRHPASDQGPAYTVHLSRQGPVVVLLLCGSDKSGQAAAIKQAVAYLNDWRKRGEP